LNIGAITTIAGLIRGGVALLQKKPPKARSWISTSTAGNSIVAGDFYFQWRLDLIIRQRQVLGTQSINVYPQSTLANAFFRSVGAATTDKNEIQWGIQNENRTSTLSSRCTRRD
jgi:hypothetical protein